VLTYHHQVPQFLADGLIDDFSTPTGEPSPEDGERWQAANRAWWESHPMEYEWDGHGVEPGTQEFFDAVDARFLASAATYLPSTPEPFGALIPYADLPGLDVLEIGVGSGTHAALLARTSKTFTGVDLTQHAVDLTRQRLRLRGLDGDVRRMDAEALEFPDDSFDLIWSWGVIHHSSQTSRILEEMGRVLRPGGRAIVMVYHRGLWTYYVLNGVIRGFLMGDLFRTRSLHKTAQRATDGAIARFYSRKEWRELAAGRLPVEQIEICGDKVELIPLPAGRLKQRVHSVIPNRVSRFVLSTLRQGTFLVAHHRAGT
jgi:SAM-dependent methyltransferase